MQDKAQGFFEGLSVAMRLGIAGFFAIICILVTGYTGYSGLSGSIAGLGTSATAASSLMASTDGDMMHDALRADVLNALVTGPEGSEEVRKSILQDVTDHADRFQADQARLGELTTSPEIQAKLDTTNPLIAKYVQAARDTATLALTDQAAGKAAFPAFADLFGQLEEEMGAQGELIEAQNAGVTAAVQAKSTHLLRIFQIAVAAAIAVLVLSNLLLSRSITRPLTRTRDAIRDVVVDSLGSDHAGIRQASTMKDQVGEIALYMELLRQQMDKSMAMESAIKRTQEETERVVGALSVGMSNLSAGNLTQSLSEAFPEHYEGLRGNYNSSVARLNQTISQVVRASRSIRGQSDEITRASEDLARRTENQAATLEQTAAALDELTASVRTAANSAREVETIVQAARREAEDSGQVVLGAVDAMNGIEKSSDQISQIIGVIDDIAFQTNLLALNAGVEAARAGDAGRGFAVVASEVRALAQRSSEASKQIKELISSSSQLVDRGVEAVGSAGQALTAMVGRVTNISNLVSEIAKAAQEQSLGLGEVNIGVNQLDQVAQKNAAMVEQSMLATQSLREEAIGLDGLVTQFTTTGAAAPPRLRAVGE